MKALLLVDIQNDFCPGGALGVVGGDEVVAVANKLMATDFFDMVVATQDWHPADHGSFASNAGTELFTVGELEGITQVWWPDHCVQGSKGAELHAQLNLEKVAAIFRKGMNSKVDSYSAFFENNGDYTNVSGYIGNDDDFYIDLYVMGLATDYCVKFTALDAVKKLGYNVHLIKDGCRAVNMNPGDEERAIDEMKAAGVTIVTSDGSVLGEPAKGCGCEE